LTPTWELREEDREFFERELHSFLPDRVYDMHAHLWRERDWEGRPPEVVRIAPPEITLEVYKECMEWIFPGRAVHGLHFPYPATFPNDPLPCNEWVSAQIKKDPLARGQLYVRPTDDPEWVRAEMKRLGLRGLKPFAGFAERPDKENAEIPEFFPEWMARLAHEEGWSVTLHLMRRRSLADPSNQGWVRTYCQKYPDMLLILDHCARGFNPYHALAGLQQLQGLGNLYADTSAVCSPLAVLACLELLGVRNVLYGSDFYCSHLRGTNLPLGDSFLWLGQDTPVWPEVLYDGKPVLLGLENLRAIKAACQILRLRERAVEAMFWDNAARLLAL
jgi:glutamate-1-semialdehyde 2,1-aminomutase